MSLQNPLILHHFQQNQHLISKILMFNKRILHFKNLKKRNGEILKQMIFLQINILKILKKMTRIILKDLEIGEI